MKKVLILSLSAFVFAGCQSAAQQQQTNQTTTTPTANANTMTATTKTNDSAIVSSHSNDVPPMRNPTTANANQPATNSTESPMARPIDVAALTADIEKAEANFKKNPAAKAELAKAYFVRATALTGAAQYRAALGDYRKGLKLDAADEDAKKMHDQILSIFKSIGREPPKEGAEPAPLPFNK